MAPRYNSFEVVVQPEVREIAAVFRESDMLSTMVDRLPSNGVECTIWRDSVRWSADNRLSYRKYMCTHSTSEEYDTYLLQCRLVDTEFM